MQISVDHTIATPSRPVSATAVLRALHRAGTPHEISVVTGLPVFCIRSSMRELVEAGLVLEDGGRYKLSEAGLARITEKQLGYKVK